MAPVTLRIDRQHLSVYGDRRASMAGEPAAITARLEILTDLLRQLEEQRIALDPCS